VAILGWIGWGLSVLINLYMMVLFARVILDWVPGPFPPPPSNAALPH